MAHKVVMAQLSPTMEEGRLVKWLVEEGDEVAQGDVVAEIETDKANMDVEAMGGGVLRAKVVEEGTTVPVGALIGVIAEPDEEIDELLEEAEAASTGEEDAPAGAGTEASGVEEAAEAAGGDREGESARADGEEAPAAGATAGEAPPAAGDGRVKASPVARKMAEESGLALDRVSGSGPGGRIVKKDVEAALEEGVAAGPAAAPAAPAGPTRLVEETLETSQMRKAIARQLTQSLGPVPHFFLTTEIDMGRALELRAELNEKLAGRGGSGGGGGAAGGDAADAAGPVKIGVNDLLLKAVAEALARHPEINASWQGDHLRRHGSADIGIAVAVPEGLITPVLRDADRKGLERIAREARTLIGRARDRDLQPEEYRGATFSVSNLGMFEIEEFTAIINPPEAGILAVGRTKEKPVVVDGEVVVRKRMRVTMSCDHRVIDGAMGARFLETFKGMLENPLEMLL